MNWMDEPTGAIRRESLLNALLAVWKTRQSNPVNCVLDDYSIGYEHGFLDGLDVIAQIVGLSETFEARKVLQRNVTETSTFSTSKSVAEKERLAAKSPG